MDEVGRDVAWLGGARWKPVTSLAAAARAPKRLCVLLQIALAVLREPTAAKPDFVGNAAALAIGGVEDGAGDVGAPVPCTGLR